MNKNVDEIAFEVIIIDKVVIVDSKDLKNKIKYCLEKVNFKLSSNEFVLKSNIVSKFKSGSGHVLIDCNFEKDEIISMMDKLGGKIWTILWA